MVWAVRKVRVRMGACVALLLSRTRSFIVPLWLGAFSLTTLWAVEALGRAGKYEPDLLNKAVAVFEVSWFSLVMFWGPAVKPK